MPDAAYHVARSVARQLVARLQLVPPFDVEAVARRFAVVLEESIPTHADVIVLHAARAGDMPVIAIEQSLSEMPERRSFAIAHGLGHVLLGWHPLGAPCDVATQPAELPVRSHDLVEGEAHAFARELLLPPAWIESLGGLDTPARLMRVIAERGGTSIMAAARSVSLLLTTGFAWAVTDRWGRVLDAGRSPGTSVTMPPPGAELDTARYARHADARHRDQHRDAAIHVWHFADDAVDLLPHEHRSRALAERIARDLGAELDERQLASRLDGIAGWANAQPGTDSLEGMARVLVARAAASSELTAAASHPRFDEMLHAKARELVAKRLAR